MEGVELLSYNMLKSFTAQDPSSALTPTRDRPCIGMFSYLGRFESFGGHGIGSLRFMVSPETLSLNPKHGSGTVMIPLNPEP